MVTAQISPPSLALIWIPIFVATETNWFFLEIVLAMIIWTSRKTSRTFFSLFRLFYLRRNRIVETKIFFQRVVTIFPRVRQNAKNEIGFMIEFFRQNRQISFGSIVRQLNSRKEKRRNRFDFLRIFFLHIRLIYFHSERTGDLKENAEKIFANFSQIRRIKNEPMVQVSTGDVTKISSFEQKNNAKLLSIFNEQKFEPSRLQSASSCRYRIDRSA